MFVRCGESHFVFAADYVQACQLHMLCLFSDERTLTPALVRGLSHSVVDLLLYPRPTKVSSGQTCQADCCWLGTEDAQWVLLWSALPLAAMEVT